MLRNESLKVAFGLFYLQHDVTSSHFQISGLLNKTTGSKVTTPIILNPDGKDSIFSVPYFPGN